MRMNIKREVDDRCNITFECDGYFDAIVTYLKLLWRLTIKDNISFFIKKITINK